MAEISEETTTPAQACNALRKELVNCLHKSDCMKKDGKTMGECMKKEADGVNTECRVTIYSFYECRRSMLDMRTRFRGRKEV
ncbi:cytochrome c oxidase assembly factor 5 isoform X2 [Hydra vulgaris]|uniref:Cytochrome c oxidase assembly factor 5 n=1 Tax=Hydra vulgaris TaxID=6087 RepID=A0ABM4CZM0_HYDVU